MVIYQYYQAEEKDIFDGGYCSLERRVGRYVPCRGGIGGFEEIRNRVELVKFPEEQLETIYCDSKVLSPPAPGRKKYWLFGDRLAGTPAVYGVEFVVKSGSEEQLDKFESEGLGIHDKVLFSLDGLRNFGIKILESRRVSQAAFGFEIKNAEYLLEDFEEGPNVDYFSECRSRLEIDLPEEDGGEGMVVGNIEPVLDLADYLLQVHPMERYSIAFR